MWLEIANHMKEVQAFLHELMCHNNREWFQAHKDEYKAAQAKIASLAEQLIDGIREFDPTIGPLSVSDCTYRIYKDMRFSLDKTPYKTHMGIFIAPGGRKSGHAGYYFQVGPTDCPDFGDRHILGCGNYFTLPATLKILREDIQFSGGEFDRIVKRVDPFLELDMSTALKKVPRGFPQDTPDELYYRLKNHLFFTSPSDEFVQSPQLVDELLRIFRTAQPFVEFLNRAIDYARGEGAE